MNLFNLFRKSFQRSASRRAAHLTFARKSITASVSRTAVLLKRQIWIFPILAVLVLSVIGYGLNWRIAQTMKANLKSQLQALLDVEVAIIDAWLRTQTGDAESLANALPVRESIYKILDADLDLPLSDKQPAPAKAALELDLKRHLSPGMSAHEFFGYFVVDKHKRIVSASNPELIGQRDIPEYDEAINRAFNGNSYVTPTYPSFIAMKDDSGKIRAGVPTMFVIAPVRDASFQVVAAIAFRLRPEAEFTRLLQLGRYGESGETYAFDKKGLMISNSRFDESLILLGLLPDQPNSHSIASLGVRDPQVDLTAGFRPKVRRSELPLTKLAAAATSGKSGVDVEGYNNYRGVPSLGAWHWSDKFGFAIATEVDRDEAYRPLQILQWTFYAVYALLALSSVAIFIFSVIVARMQREAQKAAIESKKLGQYQLETKLGEGGMGVVYKGHHAILRRPTAIKMLHIDKVNEDSLKRFEREVQITCQLNNPHTVAVYDYGRTEEHLFYYAMEYLDGIDLQTLVEKYGPQPEGRVIYILQQVCASLYEAHSLGLVHRDIKPANIMLNRRGGESDVVKVLDFGLVKALDDQKQSGLTANNTLTGTPLYMSPEAFQDAALVDARSDLYAVGAVGYFLLTGSPIFESASLVELCRQHVEQVPITPGTRLGHPVSPELEGALMACLEKSRANRPQTARDLVHLLLKSHMAGTWTLEDADVWWGRHDRGEAPVKETQSTVINKTTTSSFQDQTIIGPSSDLGLK